jgi:hypothetical protein
MNELGEMLKGILFLVWIAYVTIMCIHGAFQAEEVLDVMVAFMVWAFTVGISSAIFGDR